MSWMSQLYQTYEKNVGKNTSMDAEMTPIAHMNANAQLEVTLSREGEFLGARTVEKEHAVTLIPVTESSAGRSSGVAPHALCDTLSYVAGDFERYCRAVKKKNGPKDRFEQYLQNLRKWCESEYAHPKAQAIFRYLEKCELISDLAEAGIVELEEDRTFADRKISGQPYEKALVRFRVPDCGAGPAGTWADPSLIQAYTSYYLANQQGRTDVCYFIGEERTVAENHPKGIVAANYGAKLVSANDSQGHTYRGRFQNAEQSMSLSYEASQKIHSALTWLVRTQGVYAGTKDKRMFLCWNPEGKATPKFLDEFDLLEDEEDAAAPASYRKKLIRTFQGYRDQFERGEYVIVLGLDAATTGRLSVTYYNELEANDFLDRLFAWQDTCKWYFLRFEEGKRPYLQTGTPTFRQIADAAYGRERGNFIETDDRVLKEQVQRLLKCMLDGAPIPFDLMQALALRASVPTAYSRTNWERILSAACAVIAKYHLGKKNGEGEKDAMKLDENNRDRSYLFGRLLAVCEKVERETYDKGDTREPNAIRLLSAFVNHPMQTWLLLENQLNPYYQKLTPWQRNHYRELITGIVGQLRDEDEKKLNQGLRETYLLGYYLQRAELNHYEKK